MPSSADGEHNGASRSSSGLPHSPHQQIAKYELPLPRGPAVQPGRPPIEGGRPLSPRSGRTVEWTDGASRLSVCGDAAASAFVRVQSARQHLAKPRVTQERPLLSPATELLCKCTLQPWQVSHSSTSISWRRQTLRLLRDSSGVSQPPFPPEPDTLNGCEPHLLALDLSPLAMLEKDGEPHVIRSVSHRPSPTTYRTAWSLAYLHLLNHVGHHNNRTPESMMHPASKLRQYFVITERHESRDGIALSDNQRLLKACHMLTGPTVEWDIFRFQPSRAVVFTIDAAAALRGDPVKFECIAGWARWSALLATLEGIRMKHPIPQTYIMALETRVPVYIIDSSSLSRANMARLSAFFNLADVEFSPNTAPVMPPLQFFLSSRDIIQIRSRPSTFCDRLWSLHHILAECDTLVNEKPDVIESQTLASFLYKYISTSDDWSEYYSWLNEEAEQLSHSAWVGNPLVIPPATAQSIGSDVSVSAELLISFMLSLAWPVSSIQLMSMTMGDMRRTFGSEFPFGSMELSRRPRSGIGFWDDLLLHYLPHQIQASYSLTDLFGIIRTFEVFFMPRCGLHNSLLSALEWWQVQDVSLIQHFARNDSSAQFVSRIVEHNSIPVVGHNAHSGSFEQLSAFICVYSLHFCLELEEKALRGFGFEPKPTPAATSQQPMVDTAVIHADHRLPMQLHEDPVCILGTGASRILHLVRAILLFAVLTCDNPYQIQEMAIRQQQQHIAPVVAQPAGMSPLVLLCPHPGRPVFTPFAALFAGKEYETRKQLEEHFELLLGAISELLFRECLAGLAREELFGFVSTTTAPTANLLSDPIEALKTRASKQESLGQKSVYLSEVLLGGGLLVQAFFRACWSAHRGVQSRTFAVIPETGEREGHLLRAHVSDPVATRIVVYEHLTRKLAMQNLDATSVSVYAFVPRILGPLYRLKDTPEVSTLAEGVICGDAVWTILRNRPKNLPFPAMVTMSAPSIDPVMSRDVSPRIPEVMRSRGLHEQEYFARVCRQRFEAIAAAIEMADKKTAPTSTEQELNRLVKQELSAENSRRSSRVLMERLYPDGTPIPLHVSSGPNVPPIQMQGSAPPAAPPAATTAAPPPAASSTQAPHITVPPPPPMPPPPPNGVNSNAPSAAGSASPPVAEASGANDGGRGPVAAAEWFEGRKSDVRKFLLHLYKEMQSKSEPGLSVRLDFRNRPVEEAKALAQPLTDLAIDSTHTATSILDVPFQLEITRPEVLEFAQAALTAVREEVEKTLRTHLHEGFKQLMSVREQGHSVVASARPAVICAMWQTLVHLPPHLDVLFPLALRWNHVRATLCAWLWGELRSSLDQYWRTLCTANAPDPNAPPPIPGLRWSIRCLPSEQDASNLNLMPDLTSGRLLHLLSTPKTMDRICSALYRFQCSGMATANAVVGQLDALQISPEHLDRIFVTTESSLRDTFKSLWQRLPQNSPIEVALHDPEIAAAGFLKRYAPLILGSLDDLDRAEEAAAAAERQMAEAVEPPSKRRRRDYGGDEGVEEGVHDRGGGGAARRRQMDTIPAGMALASISVQNLRKELRCQRSTVGGRRRRHRQAEEDDGGEQQAAAAGDSTMMEAPARGETAVASSSSRPAGMPLVDNRGGGEWLQSLPLTIVNRLDQPIPRDILVDKFEESFFRHRAEQQNAARLQPPSIGTTKEGTTMLMESKLNGSFPRLPQWLEHEPMWKMWMPPIKRPEGLHSPIPPGEDYVGDFGIRQRLSYFSPTPNEQGDLSERDWELIKTVLEFLHNRGIDTLYSSTTHSLFHVTVNERHGGTEWRKELDESAETGSSPATPKPPARMVGGLSLRRYLDGWSTDPCCSPRRRKNIVRRTSSPSKEAEVVEAATTTAAAAPSAIRELNDQIVL